MRALPTQIAVKLVVMSEQPAVCRALVGDLGRAGRIPEIAEAIRNAYYAPVEALLADGARDGSLAPNGDPATAAAALFGAVTISGLSRLIAGGPLDPDTATEAVVAVVLDGLSPR